MPLRAEAVARSAADKAAHKRILLPRGVLETHRGEKEVEAYTFGCNTDRMRTNLEIVIITLVMAMEKKKSLLATHLSTIGKSKTLELAFI